jgi:hypothetical protein
MEPLVKLIRAYPEIGGLTPNDICTLVLTQDQAAETWGEPTRGIRSSPWLQHLKANRRSNLCAAKPSWSRASPKH